MTNNRLTWTEVQELVRRGLSRHSVPLVAGLSVVDGRADPDGRFVEVVGGDRHLAFHEALSEDTVFWSLATGQLSSYRRTAFALGEENAVSPDTYAFDNALLVHADVLDWLNDEGRGIVVLNWHLAFDWLADVPRVVVDEAVLPLYRQHMRPRLPELSVMTKLKVAA